MQVRMLGVFQAAIEVAVGDFVRQVQGSEHQLARFIPGVVGAVAEEQLLAMKPTDCPANVVAHGTQAGWVGMCSVSHGSSPQKKCVILAAWGACLRRMKHSLSHATHY